MPTGRLSNCEREGESTRNLQRKAMVLACNASKRHHVRLGCDFVQNMTERCARAAGRSRTADLEIGSAESRQQIAQPCRKFRVDLRKSAPHNFSQRG